MDSEAERIFERRVDDASIALVKTDAGESLLTSIDPAEFASLVENDESIGEMDVRVDERYPIRSVQINASNHRLLPMPIREEQMSA